jgi:translation initiation factor IF-3
MWMEYSDVSYTVKKKASENYKNVIQQNMQAKQFDQSIEEGKLNVSRAKVLSKMLKQQ